MQQFEQTAATELAPAHEVGLRDLWALSAPPMIAAARTRLRDAVMAMVDSWLWELAGEIGNRIPDPVDYLEMRRSTFGCSLTMTLARLASGPKVPPEVFTTQIIAVLEETASDYACLLNDVFSYEFEGRVHNGVLSVQEFLNCDLASAVGIVNDLMTARLQQFERTVTGELPVLADRHRLDADARAGLGEYVTQIQDWLASTVYWHRHCGRYAEPQLQQRYGDQPTRAIGTRTGLGTQAARLY